MKDNLKSMTIPEIGTILKQMGQPAFRAKQVFTWLHKGVRSYDEMSNLPQNLRAVLAEQYPICAPEVVRRQESQKDGTIKYLWRLADGNCVETVLMRYHYGNTVCISSEVGCRMGCAFCASTLGGLVRKLEPYEMLDQVLFTQVDSGLPISHIVLMGIGEPMDNLDAVLQATQILTADYGFAWSPKRITVSTVGVRKGIERFLKESDCHLAVSLHNPFHDQRAEIMPIEKAHHLSDVVALLKQYDWSHQRRVSFEYICWGGSNDSAKHANELLRILKGLDCRINLIRFHASPDNESGQKPLPSSSEKQMEWLRDYLTEKGITTTIRKSRGEDILAACGMLVNALKE